jgi:hypothetical protein
MNIIQATALVLLTGTVSGSIGVLMLRALVRAGWAARLWDWIAQRRWK